MTYSKLKFTADVAQQLAFMAAAAGGLFPLLAVSPITILLRNKRENLPADLQNTHPVAKVHNFLGGGLFFCVATIIQGPQVIAGSYARLKRTPKGPLDF